MSKTETNQNFIIPQGVRQWHLYKLMLADGCYYVGITSQPVANRYNQHLSGEGAVWTKMHKPLEVVSTKTLGFMTYEDAQLHEDRETVRSAWLYGPKYVRGGQYCTLSAVALREAVKRYKPNKKEKRRKRTIQVSKRANKPKKKMLSYPNFLKSGPVRIIKPAGSVYVESTTEKITCKYRPAI